MVQGAFTAAFTLNGTAPYLWVCRTVQQSRVGYYDSGRGCVYTINKYIHAVTDFQVLTGTGMDWVIHSQGADAPPNLLLAAINGTINDYVGRVNNHGSAFIGKWTPKQGTSPDLFLYNYKEKEVSDVTTYDLLVC